ncbi:MAG: hypothetical protein QOE19_904 [Actinomycetota bacterium]|nr:hypothetical protein [Actinomycetota bacterium]
MSRPDVTVVVIVYNDRDLLPTSVGSAMQQTLRNIEIIVVDHGSDDGTSEVADSLAASDDRVRVIHLPDNEGGPGRPCNVGIDAARADYVTIVGSDDELTPDACRLMLAAAEEHGAELVLGRPLRVHLDENNRTKVWMRFLYREDAVYDGVRENTEMMRDQISAAKLYSTDLIRRHGLRFPEDLIYEDQFFTLGCYVFARRIAVVSETVYRWMIRAKSDKPSITHTRSQIANLRDRITVNQRMDVFLHENGADDLAPVKDAKFLRHDLRLYIHDLWKQSPAYQREFLDLVADYVSTFPFAVIEELSPIYRVALYMLTRRDIEGVLAAWDFIREPGRVSIELTRIDDRVYWGHRYLDDDEAKLWLDVTELGVDKTPFSQQRIYNWIASYRVEGATLRVSGELFNQLQQIASGDELRLELVLRRRTSSSNPEQHAVRTPVDRIRYGADRIGYDATLDLDTLLAERGTLGEVWDLSLRTHWNGQVNTTRVTARDRHAAPTPVRLWRRFGQLSGDLLQPFISERGNLSFRLVGGTRGRARMGKALRRARRGLAKLRSRASRVAGGRRRLWVYRNVFMRLPVKPGLVFFEAFQGRQYSDSPKAIYQELRSAHPQLETVWSRARGRRAGSFPADSRTVERGSWAYYWAMARSQYWVDNFGMPRNFPKRPETTYVQTWHGTPAKRMFFDTPRVQAMNTDEKAQYQALVDQWDYLVSPSPYFEETMVRATHFGGTLIRAGMPRNDALVTQNTPDSVAQIKAKLDLPTDRRILLFAPTYRPKGRGRDAYTKLEMLQLAEHLGDEWYVLRRQHYYRKPIDLEPRLRYFGRDASGVMDVNRLLLASDALITDFSSLMFDYALLRRPMLFYVPDLDYYSNVDPKTYFDLREVAPGPVLSTTEEVVDAMGRLDEITREYKDRYTAFLERFAPLDDGRGAEAVVRRVWGTGQPGEPERG